MSTAIENLQPQIWQLVRPQLSIQLQSIHQNAELPLSLQIDQLRCTIEESLCLSEGPRYVRSRMGNTGGTVRALTDATITDNLIAGTLPDNVDGDNMDDAIDLILHALSSKSARSPRFCAVCESTTHTTDQCFKLGNYLFTQMQVDVPHTSKT